MKLYSAEHIDEGAQRDILSIKHPNLKVQWLQNVWGANHLRRNNQSG